MDFTVVGFATLGELVVRRDLAAVNELESPLVRLIVDLRPTASARGREKWIERKSEMDGGEGRMTREARGCCPCLLRRWSVDSMGTGRAYHGGSRIPIQQLHK